MNVVEMLLSNYFQVDVNSDSVLLPPGVSAAEVIGVDATGKVITTATLDVIEKGTAAVVGIDATGRIVRAAPQDVPGRLCIYQLVAK